MLSRFKLIHVRLLSSGGKEWVYSMPQQNKKKVNRGNMFEVEDNRSMEEKQRDINVFHSVQQTQRNWQTLATSGGTINNNIQSSLTLLQNLNPEELCIVVDKFVSPDDIEKHQKRLFLEKVCSRTIELLDDFALMDLLRIIHCFGESLNDFEDLRENVRQVIVDELKCIDSLDEMRSIWQVSGKSGLLDNEIIELLKKQLLRKKELTSDDGILKEIEHALEAIKRDKI